MTGVAGNRGSEVRGGLREGLQRDMRKLLGDAYVIILMVLMNS